MTIRKCAIILATLFGLVGNAQAFEALPETPPIPEDNPMTPEKIELGKMIYFDPRISGNDKISCNTCHDVMGAGADNLPTSKGIHDQLGGRNAPTVFNSAFLSVQFWDGRAPTLEEQAKGPIINPVEMGMKSHGMAVEKVRKIKGYHPLFAKVFGGDNPITIDNMAKAIAAYERTLITPNSPFDRYMKGEKKALSKQAIRGMETFQKVGCTSCHSGPAFAGPTMPMGTGFFMKFPTYADNEYVKKYDLTADPGRFEVTKSESDRNMWRVPTLRNIADTAPYFHNGKVKTLDEAVRVMGKTQLNQDLNKQQVNDIVAFLKTLSGKVPKQTAPKLPK